MEICKYQTALQPELWVLGKLDPVAAAELEEHLMTCEACQEAVEAARGLRRGLALVAAQGAARPAAARWRWLAVAALVPLAAGALLLLRHEQATANRLAAAQAEVVRLGAATQGLAEAGERDQQGRRAAEARNLELERELADLRERPASDPAAPAAPAASRSQPLVDLPTFLLAVVRDRPAGPDLMLRRSELGSAFHLALDLPDPSFTRFRFAIRSDGRELLARRDLAPSALDALLLTLPADFLPDGESRLTLFGEGPGQPDQQLAEFRIAVQP